MKEKRLFLLLFLLIAGRCVTADDRPNIILLFADDQAYRTTGANGNPQVKTPNMDALARQGVVFDNHYNCTAICMASRASIMTGMYEYKTGCNFSHGPMRPETFQKSFPVLLRDAGYRTGFAGKFGFAVSGGKSESDNSFDVMPVDAFDSWGGGRGQTNYATAKNKYIAKYADRYPHSSRAYGAFAQDFIKKVNDDERPFCLSIFFKAPHRPFTPDPYFDSVYEDVVFEKPANYGRQHGKHLAKQSRLGRQYLSFFNDMGFDEANYQDTMRKYHQLIHGVDYAIGMLREELERQGVADNTIIIQTSDNGFFCGAHGFGGKVLPYEEGSQAPLVIYDPRGSSAGAQARCRAVTGTVDIAPTILSYAGATIPTNMDGKDLGGVVEDPSTRVRDALPLFQVWGAPTTFSMSIVSETHKYIYWCYGEQMEPAEELFDLESDPLEMKNVVSDASKQKTLLEMRARYDAENDRWREQAVSYNNYKPFGPLLDRRVAWSSDKRSLIPKHMWKMYTSLNKAVGIEASKMSDHEAVLNAIED